MRWLLVGPLIVGGMLAAATAVATESEDAGPPQIGVVYDWPHDGPLIDVFSPGETAYSAGHNGVDVGAAAGDPVRAVADGVVTWAGPVAGVGWISIEHQPGLRSSVGSMATFDVSWGDTVSLGQVIGTTSADVHSGIPRLHIGFRWQDDYLDPLGLLPPATFPTPSLLGPGAWKADQAPEVPTYAPWSGDHVLGFVPDSPEATHPGWAFPPNINHVIGVAGFETATGATPIDLQHLGYGPDDITYLSYSGRTDELGYEGDPWRDQLPYDRQDTWAGVAEAALRLRDQLRAQWQAHPDQAVDLVGHSMGGLVVLYYMAVHHDILDPTLPPIGHVATFASPLKGVSSAAEVQDIKNSILGWQFDLLEFLGIGEGNSQAVADVAKGSEVVKAIGALWDDASQNALVGPLAGTQVATFGGQWDVVVPEYASSLEGGQHVVLPGGHSGMKETEAARIVLHAFLSNAPIPGQAGGLGHLASYGIDLLGGAFMNGAFQQPLCPTCIL